MDSFSENSMDQPVVELDCYEPAGQRVTLSSRELLGHTLVLGATGSGKSTTVIYPFLRQLVELQDPNPVGLVVIDLKCDPDLIGAIQAAQEFDSSRLKIISADSGHWIDPFLALRKNGLAGMDRVIERIGIGVPVVRENAFWHMTFFSLIRQVLTVLYLSDPNFTFEKAVNLLSKQLLSGNAEHIMRDHLAALQMRMEPERDEKRDRLIKELEGIQDMWFRLDQRTRSNFLSMGAPVIDPLRSPTIERIFTGDPGYRIDLEESIHKGDVIVLQLNGFSDVEAASFAAKVIKADFYEALMQQSFPQSEISLVAGLVLDEWPMSATGGYRSRSSDISALQLIRGKGGFVVAAAQSISSLDLRLGTVQRQAALSNFNNLIAMRSREEELERLAIRWFGFKKPGSFPSIQGPSVLPLGGTDLLPFPPFLFAQPKIPVIGMGDLASLETGQGFVAIGPRIYQEPLWMVPSYHSR